MQREDGQVLPLMAVFVVLAALAAGAVGVLGLRATRQARAAAAADAAALAAASARWGEADAAARASAAANGATVEALDVDQQGVTAAVTVTVTVSGEEAKARAMAGGDGSDPGLRAALERAEQLLGHPVGVQAWRLDGLAVDIDRADAAALAQVAAGAGLCPAAGVPTTGATVAFEVCEPPTVGTRGSTSQ